MFVDVAVSHFNFVFHSYKQPFNLKVQRVAAQPHHLHFTRTTVMLTLSNQAEIWCEASYDQNLIPNEISAHLDN